MRTGLRGHITALMPQEVILPRRGLTSTTSKVLRASLRNPRQHQLTPGDKFWDAERTMQEVTMAAYFKPFGAEQAELPQALQVSVLLLLHLKCPAYTSTLGTTGTLMSLIVPCAGCYRCRTACLSWCVGGGVCCPRVQRLLVAAKGNMDVRLAACCFFNALASPCVVQGPGWPAQSSGRLLCSAC